MVNTNERTPHWIIGTATDILVIDLIDIFFYSSHYILGSLCSTRMN